MNVKPYLALCMALLCVVAFCACGAATPDVDAATDQTLAAPAGNAPNFIVQDKDGNAVQLSDFAGKPVVINFWATWCGYCKLEMPDFDRAYKEYPDVVFLMINATDGVYETKEKADAYVASEGFTFSVYYDLASMAQTAYAITGYPTTVFINAQGDVVAKEVGMIDYATLAQGIALIQN